MITTGTNKLNETTHCVENNIVACCRYNNFDCALHLHA
jgi:hypothetical protein